jgi:hypothetical protein
MRCGLSNYEWTAIAAEKEGRPEAAFDSIGKEAGALEAHAAHSTHAAATAGHRRRRFLRQFGDHGLGGHQ